MLHIDVAGDGPDLVLLHGWGMHSGIWGEWLAHLQRYFRVTAVDLPGHGNSRFQGQSEIEEWAAAVLEAAPPRAWWVGWSLGGLVALAAAQQARNRLSGLVLLASTPKFVADQDWGHAVPAEVFNQFARQLETDPGRTLARFLALQVRSAERGNETLRQLRGDLRSRPAADPGALRAGLRFLQECDLRSAIRAVDMPLFWLLGERDTLIPVHLARDFPGIASTVISGAGHAPFLSHPQQCADCVREDLLRQQEYGADAAD
jgi:pimeloyl-[acyl-carrier protein] methyl ester esterase